MNQHDGLSGHERFKQLGALANSGTLRAGEEAELTSHLAVCAPCREIYEQYRVLTRDGIPLLAAACSEGQGQEVGSWDDTVTRRKLFARVRATERFLCAPSAEPRIGWGSGFSARLLLNPFARAALAACLVIAGGFVTYRLRSAKPSDIKPVLVSSETRFRQLATEKNSVEQLLAAQTKQLAQLQEQNSQREQELLRLHSALRTLEEGSNELTVAGQEREAELRAISQQRAVLTSELQDAEQAKRNVQAEFASLRAERYQAVLRTTFLESQIDELTATNHEQERKLREEEQFLASDRDIRELMSARKLYIADVFDVDSRSRTQKPFGRVFYTQGKSLIFYAFDLDTQPGLKNASIFQVWGKKETAQGEQARPKNLGILYMDSESNRRWVMRFDDSKQLAEIDAVFVTVEPHGGSQKPTGKPFLYALLRKEVNHP